MTKPDRAIEVLERLQRQSYADTGADPKARLPDKAEVELSQRVTEALGSTISPEELRRGVRESQEAVGVRALASRTRHCLRPYMRKPTQ